MCGIWDWQSTIVKDLNDSQDPKHTLFCREIVFVSIYALFSDTKCPLFTRLGGGGRPKRTLSTFFTVFFSGRLPLQRIGRSNRTTSQFHCCKMMKQLCVFLKKGMHVRVITPQKLNLNAFF